MEKLKNKLIKDGGYVCGGYGDRGCGRDAGIGVIINGIVFCVKCGQKFKGERK